MMDDSTAFCGCSKHAKAQQLRCSAVLSGLHGLKLQELKALIDREGLAVRQDIGGHNRRTKVQMVQEIEQARAQARAAPSLASPQGTAPYIQAAPAAPDAPAAPVTTPSLARSAPAFKSIEPKELMRHFTQDDLEMPEIGLLEEELHNAGLLKELRDGQPVQIELLQFAGIAWMRDKEKQEGWKGGILGDEMGLGKTLQTLCAMSLNKYPTLLVCPLQAFQIWIDDSAGFFASGTFEIYDYHQIRKDKRILPKKLPDNSLVLVNPQSLEPDVYVKTSMTPEQRARLVSQALSEHCYVEPTWNLHMLELEARKRDINVEDLCGEQAGEERAANPDSQLLNRHFGRIVCDEAHFMKNLCSKGRQPLCAKACELLGKQTDIRWCITGTPVENSITDYFSLLTFLQAEPYCQLDWFENHVGRYCRPKAPLSPQHDPDFKRCFRETMLRRDKSKLPNLPTPHFCLIECEMDDFEKQKELQLLQEELPGPELVKILRQAQAAAALAPPRSSANAKLEQSSLEQILEISARPIPEGGLGQRLRPKKMDEDGREWCLQKFLFERAWIEADKRKLLQSSKWRALRRQLEDIWENDLSNENEIECTGQPPDNQYAGLWTSEHESYFRPLDTHELTKVVLITTLTTRTFQLAEKLLEDMQVEYCKIDQSVEHDKRLAVIESFNTDPSKKVMLLGMKCGGTGINLPAAQVAILLDWWWNPAAELQALNRIHRLSSKHRNVYFFKLFSANNEAEQRQKGIQEEKHDIYQALNGRNNEDEGRVWERLD
ncbi:unnamed protein product [Effrenium voratum]|uniref:Uncharacterized protein n=2 Tax=Effrenium voratum TaxID=2562239 RepID=A0AA36HUK8_9DINO|nr:unnamed protein product [Effrenium voratum]